MTNEELLKELLKHEGWLLVKEQLEVRLKQTDQAVHNSKTFDTFRYNEGVRKTLNYLLILPKLLIDGEEAAEIERLRGKEYAGEQND